MCSFDMSCDEEEEIELKSIKCAVCVCLGCKRKDTCRCCICLSDVKSKLDCKCKVEEC